MKKALNPPKISSSIGKIKDPTKVGTQSVAVKTPKMKKQPGSFSTPSVFFEKSEEFQGPKHPSLRNLWDFLNHKRKK